MAQTIGFDYANIALLDDNENVITGSSGLSDNGVFRIDSKSSLGVIGANISGLAPSTSKIFGSNQNVDVSGKGTGNIQCTLTANDIPTRVINKLLGMQQENGAWFMSKDTKPPYAVLELVSQDRNGNAVYIGFTKGTFAPESRNLQTNTEQEQRTTDSIQFNGLNRNKDAKAYIEGWNIDPEFNLSRFTSNLFPGGKVNNSFGNLTDTSQDSDFVHAHALLSNQVNKARYNPGETANLSFEIKNDDLNNTSIGSVGINIYYQNELIQEIPKKMIRINANKTTSINSSWVTPKEDYKGYRAEFTIDNKVVDVLAIDVSSDINKFPRYGSLTTFTPGTDNKKLISQMKDWNINALEYYDAYKTPQEPVSESNPTSDFKQDWAVWLDGKDEQTKSGKVLKDSVDYAHSLNIKSMFYNMIYAITGDATDKEYLKSIGVKPEWLLYNAQGDNKGKLFQNFMAGYIDDHDDSRYKRATQTYLDITNPEMVDWIVDRMKPVLEKLSFDGWHGDTIGDNSLKEVHDSEGKVIKQYFVDEKFTEFANMVKDRIGNKKFTINTVSGDGEQEFTYSKADMIYSETWHGNYKDVANRIKYINFENGRSLAIPAYIQKDYADRNRGGKFNISSMLLMDAIVYSAGGSRVEVVDGENLLVSEFFPNKDLTLAEEDKKKIKNYQTFITAYQNQLRDGQSDSYHGSVVYDNGNMINLSTNYDTNSICAFSRDSKDCDILHLVNLLGVYSTDWKDAYGNREKPTELKNITVQYYPAKEYQRGNSKETKHVYLATPDGDLANQSVECSFSWSSDQYGDFLLISVPYLEYWDMLYLKP